MAGWLPLANAASKSVRLGTAGEERADAMLRRVRPSQPATGRSRRKG